MLVISSQFKKVCRYFWEIFIKTKLLIIYALLLQNVRRFGNKFEKKVAKSLHPLRVEVGSFYYFKTSTFTTFLQTHVDTTINWLLTLR